MQGNESWPAAVRAVCSLLLCLCARKGWVWFAAFLVFFLWWLCWWRNHASWKGLPFGKRGLARRSTPLPAWCVAPQLPDVHGNLGWE